jgi:hypothetical protein
MLTYGSKVKTCHIFIPTTPYGDSKYVDCLKCRPLFLRTDRGGLITFHGPGQQVVYPVLNLRDFLPQVPVPAVFRIRDVYPGCRARIFLAQDCIKNSCIGRTALFGLGSAESF